MKTVEKVGRFSIAENRGALYLRWWNPHKKKTESERLDAPNIEQARRAAKARIRLLMDPSEAIQRESGDDPTFGEIWLALEQRKRAKMEAGDLTPERFNLLEFRRDKYFRPFLWTVRTSRLEGAMTGLDTALRKGSKEHGIDRGRSPNTIDDIIKSARQAWRLAFEQGRTRYGPSSDYRTPGYTPPAQRKPKGRYAGVEELGKLINMARASHVRDMLLIEIGTSVRPAPARTSRPNRSTSISA